MVCFAQHKKPHSPEEKGWSLGYGEILLVCACARVMVYITIICERSIHTLQVWSGLNEPLVQGVLVLDAVLF